VTRYRFDSSWRRPGDGTVVLAGSPLRLFRVSPGGAHVLSLVPTGEQPPTASVQAMLDRMVDAGALHPQPEGGPFTRDDLTVVIPAFSALPPLPDGVRVVVVDDASPVPLALPAGTDDERVQLVRLPRNAGPGAARNAGLAHVRTPLVAFVDTDVLLPEGWEAPLLAHFADDRVALVAPRVAGAPASGLLGRYEQRHSPLDLGDEPGRVAAGTRVSYVPAATIVCRADAVRAVGGFDAALRYGEDVDLVWRLADAGHRCRYEPAVVVLHRPRDTWAAWARQRMGYGRSAAPLARRHPGALAPVRTSGWSAAVWALLVLRRPVAAVAVAGGTAVALQRKLRDVPPGEAARLVLLGHLAAGRQCAQAVRRVWWPIVALAGVFVPRARGVLLASMVVPFVADAMRRRDAQVLLDAPVQWADEAAYAAGVWQGVVAEREPGPLLPSLRSWPGRAAG
jgi:mycofactocin glycosyltransferase